jgi:hypothetical protein
VGKEVAIRLKISNRDKTEFANRHFFPPISQTNGVIPSASEGSPELLWNVVISSQSPVRSVSEEPGTTTKIS